MTHSRAVCLKLLYPSKVADAEHLFPLVDVLKKTLTFPLALFANTHLSALSAAAVASLINF